MYDIKVEPRHGVVTLTLRGMLTPAEVEEYSGALRDAFVAHRLQRYALVIDVEDCPIQSQETIAAMQRTMAPLPKAGAIAIITGSSLARLQARRLFTQPYARAVATREEALAWVISGTEPPAPRLPT